MLCLIKERTLVQNQKIHVYRNLNKKCFSIKDKKTGLVVAHADGFMVKNIKCKVSSSGRNRVLKEKQKNVHAWLDCEYVGFEHSDIDAKCDEIYYDPYTLSTFINKRTHKVLDVIERVYFENGKAYIIS